MRETLADANGGVAKIFWREIQNPKSNLIFLKKYFEFLIPKWI